MNNNLIDDKPGKVPTMMNHIFTIVQTLGYN